MYNLKYDTNELLLKEKHTHRHREQTCGCQVGEGGRGMEWEFGISRCNKPLGPTIQQRELYSIFYGKP